MGWEVLLFVPNVIEVCKAIIEVFRDEVLSCPKTEEEWKEVAEMFRSRWNYHNCLEALDSKHVAMKKPLKSGSLCYNYKGFHSIVLMAVADGYIRIVLASVAIVFFYHPVPCTILYGISILLDGIDGYAARKLNQTSAFGAWFDIVIDNFSRGLLWCSLYKWGYLVVFVEWVTFMSTHSRGSNWKMPEENFPTLVQLVMANGFKSPLGCYAVGSLHVLPLWMYMYEMRVLTLTLGAPDIFMYIGIAVFTIGRTICLSVEVFYVYHYIKHLVDCHEK